MVVAGACDYAVMVSAEYTKKIEKGTIVKKRTKKDKKGQKFAAMSQTEPIIPLHANILCSSGYRSESLLNISP